MTRVSILKKKTSVSPTLLVPGDFQRFTRTLDFYDRLARAIKTQKPTVFVFGLVLYLIACIVLSNFDDRTSTIANWGYGALVFSFFGFLFFIQPIVAIPIGFFAAFISLSMFSDGGLIFPPVYRGNLPWHALGACWGVFAVVLTSKVIEVLRLKDSCPSQSRIDFVRRNYLPLFEGDTSSAPPSVVVGIFDSPEVKMDDPNRSGRYLKVVDAVLFASTWKLSDDVSLSIRHTHRKAARYKYRKGKYKGTLLFDRIDIVMTGPHGVTEADVRTRFNDIPMTGHQFSEDGQKLKIVFQRKRKLMDWNVNFMNGVQEGPFIWSALERLSEIYFQRHPAK